jgi:hypothetical protein
VVRSQRPNAVLIALVLLLGCTQEADTNAPGAYIDLRNEPNVRLLVHTTGGVRADLTGLLRQGSWREGSIGRVVNDFFVGDSMNRGQLFVNTSSCGILDFIVANRRQAYCIGCRSGNFRAEKAGAECPLHKIETRDHWGSIAWTIVE